MKRLLFLSLLFSAPLMAQQSHIGKIKITHIEPECSIFNQAAPEEVRDAINEKGAFLTLVFGEYKTRFAKKAGVNKMVRVDLALGDFMSGIPLKYDSALGTYQYDRNEKAVVDKDMKFTQPWGSHREYSLDLIHNTISLSQIDFDEEEKEARIGLCKLHFIEQTPQDAYYLKKAAIYHRLHSKE